MENTDTKTNLVLPKGFDVFAISNVQYKLQMLYIHLNTTAELVFVLFSSFFSSVWVCYSYDPIIFSYFQRGPPQYFWVSRIYEEKESSLSFGQIFFIKKFNSVFPHCLFE